MQKSKIIFRCIEKGRMRDNMVDREQMYAVFEGLTKGFKDDNEISKKLISVIPYVDMFVVNKDLNATQDMPFIVAITGGDNANREIIKIIRYHKIVWSILNKYCENGN